MSKYVRLKNDVSGAKKFIAKRKSMKKYLCFECDDFIAVNDEYYRMRVYTETAFMESVYCEGCIERDNDIRLKANNNRTYKDKDEWGKNHVYRQKLRGYWR